MAFDSPNHSFSRGGRGSGDFRGGRRSRGGGPRGGGGGGRGMFSPGRGRGSFSPGRGRGGFSPGRGRGGGNRDFGNRRGDGFSPKRGNRGSFGRGGRGGERERGGRGGWNKHESDRNAGSASKRYFDASADIDENDTLGLMTDEGTRQNATEPKNKNKFKGSKSAPTTPATKESKKSVKMPSNEDDEELSYSDDEEEMELSHEKGGRKSVGKRNSLPAVAKNEKLSKVSMNKKIKMMVEENDQSRKEIKKKTPIGNNVTGISKTDELDENESEEDEEYSDEDESDFEDEGVEDESDSDEESSDKKEKLKLIGHSDNVGKGTADEEGSDSEEEISFEDENEEEESEDDIENAPTAKTPSKKLPLKSALKTPGTGKSDKKLILSVGSAVTPVNPSKAKTPGTPHPIKAVQKNTPNTKRLKFDADDNSADDSNEDEELATNVNQKVEEESDEDEEFTSDMDEDEESDDNDEKEGNFIDAESKVVNKQKADKGKTSTVPVVNLKSTEKKISTNQKVIEEKTATLKGVKRKIINEAPILKVENPKELLDEEQKRKNERDRQSLFVRGLPKGAKLSELKALNEDIVFVRHLPHRNFAWFIFANEENCNKAYIELSKKKMDGKLLTVDYCGDKAKNHPETKKIDLPINPLELFIGGLPPSTSSDQIMIIFRKAKSVVFPKKSKIRNKLFCFVHFENEKDAREAFNKGKTLKISGIPVDVLYARIKRDPLTKALADKKDVKKSIAKSSQSSADKLNNGTEPMDTSAQSSDNEIESSEEGIEEVEESAPSVKKAKLNIELKNALDKQLRQAKKAVVKKDESMKKTLESERQGTEEVDSDDVEDEDEEEDDEDESTGDEDGE